MLGLSHMSWLHPKRGLFRPRRHYWTTITLPGFQFFDFAFLGSSVSGILVAPALVWATHSHSQAAMASMHALGRLASTPSRLRKSFRRVEEGGSVANRAKKPRKIRSQDEGAKTRVMAVESHRLFPSKVSSSAETPLLNPISFAGVSASPDRPGCVRVSPL